MVLAERLDLLDSGGWSRVVCPDLSEEESSKLTVVAEAIRTNLADWMR